MQAQFDALHILLQNRRKGGEGTASRGRGSGMGARSGGTRLFHPRAEFLTRGPGSPGAGASLLNR